MMSLHTLGRGTWEIQASFDGTEILTLYSNNNQISFRMDDAYERHAMMYYISKTLALKTLADIVENSEKPE